MAEQRDATTQRVAASSVASHASETPAWRAMKAALYSATLISSFAPAAALFALGYGQLAAAVTAAVLAAALLATLRRAEVALAPTISFIATAAVAALSQGYIPYLTRVALAYLPPEINLTALAAEFGIATAHLYAACEKLEQELTKRGYGEENIKQALHAAAGNALALILLALAAAAASYYAMVNLRTPALDPFTALVIFAAVYLALSKLVIAKIEIQ